uniref:Fc gamma binding protein n=1 Tax=Haplochromis burtoni TaxID=8153 RepID=A0A3Q3BQL9_HAPBU
FLQPWEPSVSIFGSASLSCSSITCRVNEMCEMKDGRPSCVPVKKNPGTCWAVGDPHYRTFDGRHFNFMGTCTYVISKNCDKGDSLPAFEILAQNEHRGNLKVSYVAMVTVKVFDVTITVVRSETGRVRIDNILWSLPVTLNNDKLRMHKSGSSVLIETDFGLTVRYDWEQRLVVTLCSSYASKTCGLCGNFNGNPSDDFTTPSGAQAGGALAFGRSWKVPGLGEAQCRDGCTDGLDNCESSLMKTWESDLFCGIIALDLFSKCHKIIDPLPYIEDCKYDLCMGGGLRHFLCSAVEAYAEACQIAGVQVQEWRKKAQCPAKCPANSQYELCGSACPDTCSDPNASSKCKRPCVETCTCKAGFVLSGDKCIPAAQCGCTYEGRYIPPGEAFWADQGCKQWCKCVAGSRQVQCEEKGCRTGEECKVVDGIRKCQALSFSTCQATGDPHYMTFDKKKFNFQGTCVYQLVALCSKDPELVPFEILVQNDHRGSKVVAYTGLVEIKVYSFSIIITKTHKGQLMVNNELVNLPITLEEGKISAYKSGWYAVVTTDFGLKVSFNWDSAVFVTLPSNYMGAVCGLCGNYNGKPEDDLIPKNGKTPVSPVDFGTSWRVAEIPGCVEGCKGVCPDCDINQKVQYEKDDFCGVVKDAKGPFRDCHAKVDPASFFEDCVYDVCLYKGRKDVLCKAITAYTSACQAAGANVYNWRTVHFCRINSVCLVFYATHFSEFFFFSLWFYVPFLMAACFSMQCPTNTHYEICAIACPATCQSLTPPKGCQAQCAEGCSCDDGYILSGDACVPLSECGCVYNNRYYRTGEVFYPNGQCEEECNCKKGGEVECKKFTCGPNEKCKIEDGVQKCHPVGKGVCQAAGDPHYLTFDGKKFDFQGTCTYTLSKSCGLEGTHLVDFSVQVENEQWDRVMNRKVVSVTKLVAVEVYGFTLIMRNNMFGVLVNGVLSYLPMKLNDGAILVYQEGNRYVIATNFGLLVTYDLVYQVTVTVPGNYRGKVCGLCGNYNGDRNDDFEMPNRRLTNNVNEFGKSWKVTIPNVVCENGCEGNSCPECDPALKAVFSKSAYCGIMTNPNGPFAVCHSILDPQPYFADCVFDLCASNGDGKVLCDSVAAYAFNCHAVGADVKNWRTPSFCPMKCPINSHYEVCAEACSASCAGLTEIVQCPSNCTEGCDCDAGFLFNGQTCVKEIECGCYENGKTYKEDCNRKCTCNPGKDPCKDLKCRAQETCRVEKGEATCIPKYTGTCWAWGDPHYHTFDGYNYDFQGTCKYVISKTCGELDGLVPFLITERNDNRGNTAVSYVRNVDVFVYDYQITIQKNQVDGELLNLPVLLGDGKVSVLQRGNTAQVETDFGLVVSYDWNWYLVIKLPSSYFGLVCGLCGNFNANVLDEMLNPAGKPVSSVIEWGKSWLAPEQDKEHPCWDTCEKNCPTCDNDDVKLYKTEAFCGALADKTSGLFQKCHEKVDPQAFMNNCVYDMCYNKGDKKMLCQALASYSDKCRDEGIIIKNWRTKFGCPMNCPRNSHYEDCASPCQPSCPLTGEKQVCSGTCVETCVCDEGYVLSAGVCVPTKTCGCSYQGRYYKPGQQFWDDEACHRLCECDMTLGIVACREASCSAKEQCTVVDGERACRPISYATCSASGDPHYRTFDGRRYNFQGTCVYQLAGLCSQQPGLVPFNCTLEWISKGHKIIKFITGGQLAGGHCTRLLISLPRANGRLKITQEGRNIIVRTAFGLTVLYDTVYYVEVIVPSTYQGKMCGLCGNYNKNGGDDFILPGGKQAKNVDEFGMAWTVDLPGYICGGCGGQCPECEQAKAVLYGKSDSCGIISAPNGPFKACHSVIDPAVYLSDCVFDVCAVGGNKDTLCNSVQAYALACQSAGVQIQQWRSNSFCPASCPPHSHYELCADTCSGTCASFVSPFGCFPGCFEGCQCDDGFVFNGVQCVVLEDCGCMYNGRYLMVGQELVDNDCKSKCVCQASGMVKCEKLSCASGEVCDIRDGVRGCHLKQGQCVVSRDGQLSSFDGMSGAIGAQGAFQVASLCDESAELWFRVVVDVRVCNKGAAPTVASVYVFFSDTIVAVNSEHVTWVNGRKVSLPSKVTSTLSVQISERALIIERASAVRVTYSISQEVTVIIHSSLSGKMCGACGNYNNDSKDDMTTADGKITTDKCQRIPCGNY